MKRTRSRLVATALSSAVVVAGLAEVVPVSPAAAQAAPDPGPPAVVEEPAVQPSTAEERRAALTLLNIRFTPELMLLDDREFVLKLWPATAVGSEARAAAELALFGTANKAAEYIRTELGAALIRDQQQLSRDQESARVARVRRQAAAAAIGLVLTPEMLLRSDQAFVVLIWTHAPGRRVKEAAVAAIDADTTEALDTFLTEGIFAASHQDYLDARAESEETDAAEIARQELRDAKRHAAALIGVIATEELLVRPNLSFVAYVMNNAPANTRVRAAATAALDTEETAKAFIFTGIRTAAALDIQDQRTREEQADRDRALAIRTRAAGSLVHPRLVAAADEAMGAGPDAVRTFLLDGQYQYLVQSLEPVVDGSRQTWVRRHAAGNQLVIATGTLTPGPGDGRDANWRVVSGLSNANCHSFESVTQPGHFMMVSPWGGSPQDHHHKVFLSARADLDWWPRAVTWCSSRGPSMAPGVKLESQLFPGTFLRHYQGELWAADGQGTDWNTGAYYLDDITWHISGENPTTTGIIHRWYNEPALRARVGAPLGDREEVDGAIRYRRFQHENSGLYWTAATGAKAMYGSIHDKYLRVNGRTHPRLGAPVMDEATLPDGWFIHYAGGGSIYCKGATRGTYVVNGLIKSHWANQGWERGPLGWPASDELDIPSDRYQRYDGGVIAYNWNAGTLTTYSHQAWAAYVFTQNSSALMAAAAAAAAAGSQPPHP